MPRRHAAVRGVLAALASTLAAAAPPPQAAGLLRAGDAIPVARRWAASGGKHQHGVRRLSKEVPRGAACACDACDTRAHVRERATRPARLN